jgi:hypothetical protein
MGSNRAFIFDDLECLCARVKFEPDRQGRYKPFPAGDTQNLKRAQKIEPRNR